MEAVIMEDHLSEISLKAHKFNSAEKFREGEMQKNLSGFSDLKRKKIRYAEKYSSLIGEKNLLFLGISGSVSYEPAEPDDVDIFIISRNSSLWLLLTRCFILRRLYGFGDICLSLILDERSAYEMYGKGLSSLRKRDALNVIPLVGSDYYSELLSRTLGEGIGGKVGAVSSRESEGILVRFLDIIAFIFVSPVIYIKSLRTSSMDRKNGKGTGGFATILSRGFFYFDSEKYHAISRNLEQDRSD